MKQNWVALSDSDAVVALRAVQRLTRSPTESLRFLRENLDLQPKATRERLARLIADLDAASFARREAASAELARLGSLAEAGLKQAVEKSPSAEVRKRAEALLQKLEGRALTSSVLQSVRALEVLERIATPEARQVIAELAEGTVHARVSEEALASLARLTRR
jgi:hypothetical protein